MARSSSPPNRLLVRRAGKRRSAWAFCASGNNRHRRARGSRCAEAPAWKKAAHRPSGGSGRSWTARRGSGPAPPSTISEPNRSGRQRVSLPANGHNVARAPGGEQGRGGGSAAPPGDPPSGHQAIETASAQRRMQVRKDEYSRPSSWSHRWSKCVRTWIFKKGRSEVSRSSIIASRRQKLSP
jgi:hypothetical protein